MLIDVGSTHDRVVASRASNRMFRNLGREVVRMTAYEITMIVLRVIDTLISLSSLIIALLTFLKKRDSKQK